MRVQNISFKGDYRESETVLKGPDALIVNALGKARPYLRQIGNSMPYPRELYITVNDDGCDTFISAYDYDKNNHKAKLLARGNEHTLTEHGLDFVQKVFEGLEKNNKKEFKNIAGDFVKRLVRIQEEQNPIEPFDWPNDPDFDPHPACCGY